MSGRDEGTTKFLLLLVLLMLLAALYRYTSIYDPSYSPQERRAAERAAVPAFPVP